MRKAFFLLMSRVLLSQNTSTKAWLILHFTPCSVKTELHRVWRPIARLHRKQSKDVLKRKKIFTWMSAQKTTAFFQTNSISWTIFRAFTRRGKRLTMWMQ
ncbi:unnamed protein product [Albugo candida]|uniref:Secreted protein n=1 Tax=Albugo candida TaxID=65357 RepID=A0A024G2A9_9STRA|nr:unnamed protein product [Albugo candida]|eukprot:CCI40983.1 unnamed protein product [Albugo candida]